MLIFMIILSVLVLALGAGLYLLYKDYKQLTRNSDNNILYIVNKLKPVRKGDNVATANGNGIVTDVVREAEDKHIVKYKVEIIGSKDTMTLHRMSITPIDIPKETDISIEKAQVVDNSKSANESAGK